MGVSTLLGILIFGSFALYITINQVIVIYNRHFRGYNKEIVDFLQGKSLKLRETYSPTEQDWIRSPFERPKMFEMSLVLLTINGIPIQWKHKSYLIVIAESKKGKHERYWLEINTIYFQKPKLSFRKGNFCRNQTSNANNKNVNAIQGIERGSRSS